MLKPLYVQTVIQPTQIQNEEIPISLFLFRFQIKNPIALLIVVFPCMLIITQLLFQQNALIY
jgi:hypothetical protein